MNWNVNIIAVDPGKITGYTVWNDGEISIYGEASDELFVEWAELVFHDFDVVVCEDFIITPQTLKKTRQLYSLHQIGWLKYGAFLQGISFVLQKPGDAKSFADDDKLKRLGWHHPSPGGHQNDAHRHLLLYLINNKMIDLGELT